MPKIAIIGGGWSGLTASYLLSDYDIALFESNNILGGRARKINHVNYELDNGQHIMMGAYHNTLEIFKKLDINFDKLIKTFDLQWHVKNGIILPNIKIKFLPYKINLLICLLNIKNLSWLNKYKLLVIILKLQFNHYTSKAKTVEFWYEEYNIPKILQLQFFTPLCLSALNTCITKANINKFLHILKLTIASSNEKDSKLLIPKVNLSDLYPNIILNYLNNRRKKVLLSTTIINIQEIDNKWILQDNAKNFYKDIDILIISTSYNVTQKLLSNINVNLPNKEFNPITTLYIKTQAKISQEIPFLIYKSAVIFQKQDSIWAVVFSNLYIENIKIDYYLKDLENEFKHEMHLIQKICEKKATFSCENDNNIINPIVKKNLYLTGDYLHCMYPATLESAVCSAIFVADTIKLDIKTNSML